MLAKDLKKIASCLLITCTFSPTYGLDPDYTPEQLQQQIFQQVFQKSRPNRKAKIEIPFFIGKKQKGMVLVFITEEGDLEKFDGEAVLYELKQILRPSIVEKMQIKISAETYMTPEFLEEFRIKSLYDGSFQTLTFDVPVSARKKLEHSVIPKHASYKYGDSVLVQQPFSAFLNTRIVDTFQHKSLKGTTRTRTPLQVDLEGASRLHEWVLEGKMYFNENDTRPWAPGKISLIRDFPEQMIRVIGGDMESDPIGYQSSMLVGGLGVAKNFSLQPETITYPLGEATLHLESDSLVEVWINNELIKSFNLEKGDHLLRDFQLETGINEINLKITDSFGREKWINYSDIIDVELFAEGVNQYAITVGLPATTNEGERRYERDNPTLSLFYKQGITKRMTLGGYYQMDRNQSVTGGLATIASKYGLFEWDVGVSNTPDYPVDLATNLQWSNIEHNANQSNAAYSFSIEHLGKNFTEVGSLIPSQSKAFNWSASVAKTFENNVSANLRVKSEISRQMIKDPYQISLKLKKMWGSHWESSLDLILERKSNGDVDESAVIRFDYRLPMSGNYFSYQHRSENDGNQLRWNYQPINQYEGFDSTVTAENNSKDNRLRTQFGYKHYNFYGNFSNSWQESDSGVQSSSKINFSTAIAYTGGSFAISKPINDSFLIIVPDKALGKTFLGINPNNDAYALVIDDASPGVLSSLNSYHEERVEISAPKLSLGKQLNHSRHSMKPSYKSGFILPVVLEINVILRGQILDGEGEPIGFQAGEAVAIENKDASPVVIFTNKKGRFKTGGFKPGRYKLSLYSDEFDAVTFEVPKGVDGVVSMPPIRIRETDPFYELKSGNTPEIEERGHEEAKKSILESEGFAKAYYYPLKKVYQKYILFPIVEDTTGLSIISLPFECEGIDLLPSQQFLPREDTLIGDPDVLGADLGHEGDTHEIVRDWKKDVEEKDYPVSAIFPQVGNLSIIEDTITSGSKPFPFSLQDLYTQPTPDSLNRYQLQTIRTSLVHGAILEELLEAPEVEMTGTLEGITFSDEAELMDSSILMNADAEARYYPLKPSLQSMTSFPLVTDTFEMQALELPSSLDSVYKLPSVEEVFLRAFEEALPIVSIEDAARGVNSGVSVFNVGSHSFISELRSSSRMGLPTGKEAVTAFPAIRGILEKGRKASILLFSPEFEVPLTKISHLGDGVEESLQEYERTSFTDGEHQEKIKEMRPTELLGVVSEYDEIEITPSDPSLTALFPLGSGSLDGKEYPLPLSLRREGLLPSLEGVMDHYLSESSFLMPDEIFEEVKVGKSSLTFEVEIIRDGFSSDKAEVINPEIFVKVDVEGSYYPLKTSYQSITSFPLVVEALDVTDLELPLSLDSLYRLPSAEEVFVNNFKKEPLRSYTRKEVASSVIAKTTVKIDTSPAASGIFTTNTKLTRSGQEGRMVFPSAERILVKGRKVFLLDRIEEKSILARVWKPVFDETLSMPKLNLEKFTFSEGKGISNLVLPPSLKKIYEWPQLRISSGVHINKEAHLVELEGREEERSQR